MSRPLEQLFDQDWVLGGVDLGTAKGSYVYRLILPREIRVKDLPGKSTVLKNPLARAVSFDVLAQMERHPPMRAVLLQKLNVIIYAWGNYENAARKLCVTALTLRRWLALVKLPPWDVMSRIDDVYLEALNQIAMRVARAVPHSLESMGEEDGGAVRFWAEKEVRKRKRRRRHRHEWEILGPGRKRCRSCEQVLRWTGKKWRI